MARDLEPVTREGLRRALLVNAATKPLNVALPAGIVVAALLLGQLWLVGVAFVVGALLCALTFFDGDEAERVGRSVYGERRPVEVDAGEGLDPAVRRRLDAARDEVAGIERTVEEADLPFAEVSREVDGLLRALEGTARRVQRLREHLRRQDPDEVARRAAAASGPLRQALEAQHAALADLRTAHDRGFAEMDEVLAALSTVHARLVRAALVDDEASDRALAGDVRELRTQVEGLTDSLTAAYAPPGASP